VFFLFFLFSSVTYLYVLIANLRSASRRKLNIPRFRCSTFGTWVLSVAIPIVGLTA